MGGNSTLCLSSIIHCSEHLEAAEVKGDSRLTRHKIIWEAIEIHTDVGCGAGWQLSHEICNEIGFFHRYTTLCFAISGALSDCRGESVDKEAAQMVGVQEGAGGHDGRGRP